jgi:hypothetical protein
MFDSLIQAIQDSVATAVLPIAGVDYTTRPVHFPPEVPLMETLSMQTLTGLAEYLTKDIDGLNDGGIFVQINSPTKLSVLMPIDSDQEYRRVKPVRCSCEDLLGKQFSYGQYRPLDETIVDLQARFAPTPQLADLLNLLGNVKDENVGQYNSDGVTQSVVIRKGIALAENREVDPRVTLVPYRTFPEISQPPAEFILRLKSGQNGNPPTCALFESSDSTWKLAAMKSIKTFLEENLPDLEITILA